MRSDRAFVAAYRAALVATDPAANDLDLNRIRGLGQTELCLEYLHRFLPGESHRTVPFLMMGYPKLLAGQAEAGAERALTTLRHLCSGFGSMSAWTDAIMQYSRVPETRRCFEISGKGVVARRGAPTNIKAVLQQWLDTTVPWIERTLDVALPGEAEVFVDRAGTPVSYEIPPVPPEQKTCPQHALIGRRANPPIRVTFAEMKRIARKVDERESQPEWPVDSLPRLKLAERLEKLAPKGLSGFFDGDTFTVDGATHVVGMLSSGKSTLVTALTMALALGGSGKRIAILVGDTVQGAIMAARLRRHGVKATVLSSVRNRQNHLHTIHWRRSLDATGWKLSSLGDIADGFSTACPLDGYQSDPELIAGDIGTRVRFPSFPDKQCHRLYQSQPPDNSDDDWDPDDISDSGSARSCPLWPSCPAQEQQRTAVEAQVLIMTAQAFVHITPDKWTTERHLSLPELLQYAFDLVIVDEADGVQKALDEAFAPRSPIMGDEHNVYAPSIGLRSSEALRERSGVQFRKPVNAKWQSNFFTFFRLIGIIYAILQNERDTLRPFYENSPFTAGAILYDLWRRRREAQAGPRAEMSFADPEFAEEFLDVIRVAGAIKAYSAGASVAEDATEEEAAPRFSDTRFAQAATRLQQIARNVLVADYYDAVIPEIADALDGDLAPFRAARDDGPKSRQLSRHGNALALLLATVTDLALSHYNWLIKTQAAVAQDFKIDDGHLLGQTNNLIKHYRTLLPANPAGAAFGLFYDEPRDERRYAMGGRLTLISHLGVGRHLLTHLHDLLAGEGQAGPHVLMLSGTSWAGGSTRQRNPKTGEPMDAASPSFDVQVPVKGVLVQPEPELEAIRKSVFGLVHIRDSDGLQMRVSGRLQRERRTHLAAIAESMALRRDSLNRLEDDWRRMEARWSAWRKNAVANRRRAMLVTNSYADAAVVADTLAAALDRNGYAGWKVHCLVRDSDATMADGEEPRLMRANGMPRSLVERFGAEPEHSILVAPLPVIARGHNILNEDDKAAISAIYFLHRPHPRPDDLGPTIGRLNRFAQERFDHGVKGEGSLAQRARQIRYRASQIVRYGLEAGRGGYRSLPPEFKAQFAWDMLTPLWQTIGRGIRGGCPVFIGFVDSAFAPHSFAGTDKPDTTDSSVLVQSLHQLREAMDPTINPADHEVAKLLYEPFHDALARTEGLRHA